MVVNKLDLVDFSEARFRELEQEARAFLAELGLSPMVVLPLSARHGDNLARASANLAWHQGPTLVEALIAFGAAPPAERGAAAAPLQDIYRQEDQRILVGRIETGRLRQGDTLLFSPSNKLARVKRIEAWPGPAPEVEEQGARSASRWTGRSSSSAARWRAMSRTRRSSPTASARACSGWARSRWCRGANTASGSAWPRRR